MDKAKIVSALTSLRQATIADRTQKKQEKRFVEENKRPLLSLRRRGSQVVLSGDANCVKKLQEAVPILVWLKEILEESCDIVESPEFVTDEVEDPVYIIPKLFCQIGDKANGWGVKPVEKMAMLLLTALDAGQGGSVTLSDKSKAKPAWFNNDAGWSKYTQPSSATLEENTDLILGIFRFHGLDPKTHNLRPLEEESDEVDGDLDEAEDEVDEGHENATEHEEERLSDSLDNVILQHVNDAMEVEIETIWSEQVQASCLCHFWLQLNL